jgi:transcriptional regulator
MYIPKAFAESRVEILHEFIRRHSFAILLTTGGEMTGSHLPILLDAGRGRLGTLRGHMARANSQWRALSEGVEALVIFSGPHAYVSPSWYQTPASVPTWNYAVVHAYGQPTILDDGAASRQLLEDTVDLYEAAQPEHWSMDRLPVLVAEKMEAQIVGFEIEITRLEGKFKLNQNRTAADRQGVIDALSRSDQPDDRRIAQMMSGTPAGG